MNATKKMRSTRTLQIVVGTLCLVNSAMAGWITSGTNMYSDVSGNVGIGTSTPGSKLDVNGTLRLADTMFFSNSTGAMNWQMRNEGPGIGPSWFAYFSHDAYDARISLTDYISPAPRAKSIFLVQGAQTDTDLILDGRLGLFGDLVVGSSGTVLFADVSTGKVGIGTTTPSKELTVRGNIVLQGKTTDATVVELGEGLDYAEGFDVTKTQDVNPGTVLVIDPAHPGKLAVSTAAYDTKVAGIVAGAKGLGSGVRLGTGQFDQNVALAGRVYCNVDTTETAVQPGDLLTTSATAGYAMKVSDPSRAHGCILGKAMESLERGKKGQILVLVTLQ